MSTREIRITGGRATIRAALAAMVDAIDDSNGDIEVELQAEPNIPGQPSLLLNLNSTGCDDDEDLLVEYEEIADDA